MNLCVYCLFQILLLVAASLVNNVAVGTRDDASYETVDDICKKCKCSEIKGTVYAMDEEAEERKVTSYFQLDCSLKSFKHLLAGWPEQVGTNHSGERSINQSSLLTI